MLKAEQDASYPDLGPVMDSNDGGPEVESSDSDLEGLEKYHPKDICNDIGTEAMSSEDEVGPLHLDRVWGFYF